MGFYNIRLRNIILGVTILHILYLEARLLTLNPLTSRLDYCIGLLCGITDELLIIAASRRSKAMPPEWLVYSKCMITLHQF